MSRRRKASCSPLLWSPNALHDIRLTPKAAVEQHCFCSRGSNCIAFCIAFFASNLRQAVLDGTAPEALSLYAIIHRGLTLTWDEQQAMFAARPGGRALIRSVSLIQN
ncbi:hypothetical protein BREVUG8_100537 [Brevundimonas sp. G8]|nr:hypothetical protein BREVUG8_100537 [Brevundimonas sp. G8]